MPPSGFSKSAVSGLRIFLLVTLQDLKDEVAKGEHASLEDGLRFEIDKISKVEHSSDLRPGESSALGLTKDFYKEVLERGEDEVLRTMTNDFLSLHIDEKDNLTRRPVAS